MGWKFVTEQRKDLVEHKTKGVPTDTILRNQMLHLFTNTKLITWLDASSTIAHFDNSTRIKKYI